MHAVSAMWFMPKSCSTFYSDNNLYNSSKSFHHLSLIFDPVCSATFSFDILQLVLRFRCEQSQANPFIVHCFYSLYVHKHSHWTLSKPFVCSLFFTQSYTHRLAYSSATFQKKKKKKCQTGLVHFLNAQFGCEASTVITPEALTNGWLASCSTDHCLLKSSFSIIHGPWIRKQEVVSIVHCVADTGAEWVRLHY